MRLIISDSNRVVYELSGEICGFFIFYRINGKYFKVQDTSTYRPRILQILLLYTGRHFWNRKCRKKTWWQQEFAVFKCEATANSITGHVCVYSNQNLPAALRSLCHNRHRNKKIIKKAKKVVDESVSLQYNTNRSIHWAIAKW